MRVSGKVGVSRVKRHEEGTVRGGVMVHAFLRKLRAVHRSFVHHSGVSSWWPWTSPRGLQFEGPAGNQHTRARLAKTVCPFYSKLRLCFLCHASRQRCTRSRTRPSTWHTPPTQHKHTRTRCSTHTYSCGARGWKVGRRCVRITWRGSSCGGQGHSGVPEGLHSISRRGMRQCAVANTSPCGMRTLAGRQPTSQARMTNASAAS